jgi:hypothetical protein
MDVNITLVIPTRGVIFARTIESSILNKAFTGDTIIVEGYPIPEAHNECIRRALKTDCTHILFLEEDMVIPEGGLEAMIELAKQGHKYVAIDYKVTPVVNAIQYNGDKPWFTGFGCTLFDRTLFEKEFQDPWLSDEYDILIDQMTPLKYHIEKRKGNQPVYGKYDVLFGSKCHELGLEITVVPDMMCAHLRTDTKRETTNKNVFAIYEI